jgi:hypothetical protein
VNFMMRWSFLFILMIAALPLQAQTLSLIADSKSDYVITLAADAIPAEQTAARELQSILKEMSGVELPIRSETDVPENAPQILVGSGGERAAQLVKKANVKSLRSDDFYTSAGGKSIILAGGRPRGTLYAVYEFLETLGCRFWAPGESTIPQRKSISVAPLNKVYSSPFFYREHYTTSVQRDAVFATRMRENGHHQPQKDDWGGHYSIIGFVHTFDTLLPPAKYAAAHPDWFGEGAHQPCMTSDGARQEIIKNALELVRKNPAAGMISVSQNDNVSPCKCAKCKALEEQEGSAAGPLLQTVNAVAEAVEKEFPGFLVETLAYQYTRKPPKHIRPRANVIIRLCSIEADFSKPLDSDANAAFRDDLLGWKAIAPRLYVWDYITNFSNSIWPHPNLRVLAPNLRFFAANNVVGIFEQGDAYSNGTGDFPQLRAWLIGKLMWNPGQDEKKLIDEFLRGYYGAAAPHLKAYLDLMQDSFARSGQRLSTFHNNHSWLTLDVMNEATRHFRAAEDAVRGDEVLTRRVRRARLPLDHVWIVRYATYTRQIANGKTAFEGPGDLALFGEEFLKANEEFKTANWKENGPWKEYVPSLRQRLFATKPAPLPAEVKVPAGAAVLDAQEFAFSLYRRGELCDIVPDAKASNGYAARIVGHVNDWAVQWHPDDDPAFLEKGKWRCYLTIRVEQKADAPREGVAFTCGIYDTTSRKGMTQTQCTLAESADGEYRVIELGAHALKPGVYFWAAPASNQNVTAIYVDRIFCVREE